jgi:hypothetical protein
MKNSMISNLFGDIAAPERSIFIFIKKNVYLFQLILCNKTLSSNLKVKENVLRVRWKFFYVIILKKIKSTISDSSRSDPNLVFYIWFYEKGSW